MHLDILGPGRLGRTLHQVLQRPSRLLGRNERPTAQAVLLTVPDSVIAEVSRTLPSGITVLHCSGTTPFEVLRPHRPAGSFHPLMTFPGPEVRVPDLMGVPAAIDGDPEAVDLARELAEELGMRPISVPGDRRLYHAAAVIAGNFATVLLAEAARALEAAGVPAEDAPALLAPLARESLANAARVSPRDALTGPVARGDVSTLAGHREALAEAGLPDLVELHVALTDRARHLMKSEDDNLA